LMSDQTNIGNFDVRFTKFGHFDASFPKFGHFDVTHDSKLGHLMSDIPIWVKMMSEYNQAILISESSILPAKYSSSHLENIDISSECKTLF